MPHLLIHCSHLYKSFGPASLFEDISLSINSSDNIALVGPNGSGKTTLLRILQGIEPIDSGKIQKSLGVSTSMLAQEIVFRDEEATVQEFLEEGALQELEKKMEKLLHEPESLFEWEKVHEEYEKAGGYNKLPIEKVLSGLKLDVGLFTSLMKHLSGGEKRRVALAKALIDNPDLLLLDEPTNHLDSDMVQWLQRYIMDRKGATVTVSHDRAFINSCCNKLIAIDKTTLSYFSGSYNYYLNEKERLLEIKIKEYAQQLQEQKDIKQKIQAITYAKKNPGAPLDNNIMAYDKRGEKHQKAIKHTLDKLKTRLEEIENLALKNPKPRDIQGLYISSKQLPSDIAIECNSAFKAYGSKVLFSNFSHTLFAKDRVILTGPNGSGKTTLLKCILGHTPLDAGTITRNSKAIIGYLDQEGEWIPFTQSPLEYFKNQFNMQEQDIRKELHKAALGETITLHKPFSAMSVGQRKRLMLLSIILQKPNILILDEPTNDLDLPTIEALEKALLHFNGALLAVSHDQTFINKIGTKTWQL